MNKFEEWLQHNWLVNKLDPHEKQITEEAWNAALDEASDLSEEYYFSDHNPAGRDDLQSEIQKLKTDKKLKYDE